MMWFGGWAMGLWMVLFWAGVVLLVVWGVRAMSGEGANGRLDRRRDALAILEERFARGEIDRDEFESRRATLEGR